MTTRKPNKQRLRMALRMHRDFLLQRLEADWDEVERRAKREALVRQTKTAGLAVGKTILALAAVAGVLTIATVAPNVLGAIGRVSGRRAFLHKPSFQQAAKSLKRRNLATITKTRDQYVVELTERGADAVLADALRRLRASRPKRWDGVWRVVLFDIPDSRKWARDALRQRLSAMGFFHAQKSVFVYPHPCGEELAFLLSLLDVGHHVRLIKTRELEHDDDIRQFFSLLSKQAG